MEQIKDSSPSVVIGLNGVVKMMLALTRNNLYSELNKDMYL